MIVGRDVCFNFCVMWMDLKDYFKINDTFKNYIVHLQYLQYNGYHEKLDYSQILSNKSHCQASSMVSDLLFVKNLGIILSMTVNT